MFVCACALASLLAWLTEQVNWSPEDIVTFLNILW